MKKRATKTRKSADVSIEARFERAALAAANARYTLRLYVSGTTPQSQRAVANIKRICEKRLPGLYALEVIDVYQFPERAKEDQIFAAPTLMKLKPEPRRFLLGDLSDESRVMRGLGIE